MRYFSGGMSSSRNFIYTVKNILCSSRLRYGTMKTISGTFVALVFVVSSDSGVPASSCTVFFVVKMNLDILEFD